MNIILQNRLRRPPLPLRTLRRRALQVLEQIGAADASLGVVLAGEVHVRSLKRRYFGGGSATDVLSFPAPALPGQPAPLGDLVICGPVLVRQARQHGAAIEMEALALLIHGCLHLTGWDHDTDSRRGKMMRRERAIFSAIAPGVPWPLEAEYARFNGEKQTV